MNQMVSIDIYIKFHPTDAKYKFFLSVPEALLYNIFFIIVIIIFILKGQGLQKNGQEYCLQILFFPSCIWRKGGDKREATLSLPTIPGMDPI